MFYSAFFFPSPIKGEVVRFGYPFPFYRVEAYTITTFYSNKQYIFFRFNPYDDSPGIVFQAQNLWLSILTVMIMYVISLGLGYQLVKMLERRGFDYAWMKFMYSTNKPNVAWVLLWLGIIQMNLLSSCFMSLKCGQYDVRMVTTIILFVFSLICIFVSFGKYNKHSLYGKLQLFVSLFISLIMGMLLLLIYIG